MRRLAITILIAPFVGLAGLSLLSPSAHASTPPTHWPRRSRRRTDASQLAPVDVLQVSGIFDKIVVRSIIEAIDRAETNGSEALILQLTSRGAVVSNAEMTALLQRVSDCDGTDRHLGRPIAFVARLRLAGAVDGRRRRHRNGRRQPHRLHQHAAHRRRQADQLRRGDRRAGRMGR